MRDFQTKTNISGLPDTITATRFGSGEFNSIALELENAVTSSDQAIAPADGTGETYDQLAMALAIYGAGGAFYHADTGAVNAYVLTPISPKESPPAYFDGFTVIFEAGTVNTTASTVNVNSLGVKDITYSDGNALVGGELSGSCGIKYNLSDDRFELLFSSGALAGLSQVYVIDASQADQGAASANPNTYTVFDAAAAIGTTKNATLYFPHNPVAGNQTLFTFDTSLDLSSYPNLSFKIDQGAQFDRTTGDEFLTLYSPNILSVGKRQFLTSVDMIRFAYGGDVWPEYWGASAVSGDSTNAIQYAINSFLTVPGKGTINLHNGAYTLSSTLSVTEDYMSFKGRSRESTFLARASDYGNTILVESSYGFSMKDLRMYSDFDITSGAHIEMRECTASILTNIHISDMFGGIYARGCWDLFIDNIIIDAGINWSGDKAGSYSIRFDYYNSRYPSQIYVNNFSFGGNVTLKRLDSCIFIEASDGIWFNNGHLGFCNGPALIVQKSDISYITSAIKCTNVYFDTAENGVNFVGVGGTAGTNSNHFDGCTFYNMTSSFVAVSDTQVSGLSFSDCHAALSDATGINISRGRKITFRDFYMEDINQAKVANIYGYLFANDVEYVDISGGGVEIKGTDDLDYFIVLQNTCDNIKVHDCDFIGTPLVAPIISTSTGTNNKFYNSNGIISENAGLSAAISTGGTIAHGLSFTPNVVNLSSDSINVYGINWSADATNITVNFNGGASQTFHWEAKYRI